MSIGADCSACGAALGADARFCASCGTPAAATCPGCGATASGRFCSLCGTPLTSTVPAQSAALPVSERRVTSVLFADLVGFTPLAEFRDSEDVRDLLSRYFAVSRRIIERYGGTVEKFIGDAVMAVWGVPTTQEDDAERAVRAGLDLVDAVVALGDETNVSGLAMRVGIVTGEVAVTLGAAGEGMVAGDAVNTAARVQVAAEPGQVWVDATTHELTSSSVAYADAGRHQLKGKSESLPLFIAREVVASVRGTQRLDGLEAAFTGRDRVMRMVKELFHATLEEGRPRLVAVSGVPGVGKSRLGWEFFKHLDGISDMVRWHRGRCPSYGEGVAFRALSEIVRGRLGILDGDEPAVVAQKLDSGLDRWIPDPDERSWLSPRLAPLLGIDQEAAPGAGAARDDLFAAWLVFFERLIDDEATGVALLLEDLQWADDGLLDFLDYLLDRSNSAIFVLALARPELKDRRPGWGSHRRSTPIHLEPLGAEPMAAIVDGLVAGLSPDLRAALVTRSEGVPLYAVETVRSLIDRDVVIPRDGRYVLADGPAPALDVAAPTSLHTLIAARLDTLTPLERRTVQDAAVLGLSFPRTGLLALRGDREPSDVDRALDALVHKEILGLETDPRSPERGQYRFLQSMVRSVAYETLSRRDRKVRHLLVAELLGSEPDAEASAAIIASHYLDACSCAPDDPDARELAGRAVRELEVAAGWATTLGAPAQAQRHCERALAHVDDDAVAAGLGLRAARSAVVAGSFAAAAELAHTSYERYERLGSAIDSARALGAYAEAMHGLGRGGELPDLLIPVFDGLDAVPDTVEVRARLAINIARGYFSGLSDTENGRVWGDIAASLAEATTDPQLICSALSGYGAVLMSDQRPTMGLGLLRVALDVATRHDLPSAQLIPLNNLASFLSVRDLPRAADYAAQGLAVASRIGDRETGAYLRATAASIHWLRGNWDDMPDVDASGEELNAYVLGFFRTLVAVARGESPVEPPSYPADRGAPQWLAGFEGWRAGWLRMGGDLVAAVEAAAVGVETQFGFGSTDDDFHAYWSQLMDLALEAGQLDIVRTWLDRLGEAPENTVPALVRALLLYYRARLAAAREPSLVDGDFAAATSALREFGSPYWLARCQLDHADFLVSQGRGAEATAMLDSAGQAFAALRAAPWAERASRARAFAVR